MPAKPTQYGWRLRLAFVSRAMQAVPLLFCLGFAFTASAAQTLLGENDAMLCFHESQLELGSRLSTCTSAIRMGELTKRDLAATYSNRGIIYAKRGEYEKALADHNEAIALQPEMAQALINRGNAYYHLRQYQQALDDYTQSIDLKGGPEYLPYYNSGLTLLKMKQDAEAVIAFEKALALSPDSSIVLKKLEAARQLSNSTAPE